MMKKFVFTLMFLFMVVFSVKAQNHWVPNPYQFPTNMNVIGVIQVNDIEQTNEYLEIGVFCEDDCRGSAILQYEEVLDRYMLYLTIFGENDDDLWFKLYDHLSGQELELECENEMTFHSNAIHGNVINPYTYSFFGGSCTISAVADPPSGGQVNGGGTFPCGTLCTLTAVPTGGGFIQWQLNGNYLSNNPVFTFNAVTDLVITALFGDAYYHVAVSTSPANGGVATGGGEFAAGETCTVNATPNSGYNFDCWKEDNVVVSTNASYSFVVTSDRSLTACFSRISYQVEAVAEPVEGGVITGAGTYYEGETCVLSVATNSGFVFRHWMENGTVVSTLSSISFVVTSNRTFKAVFDLVPNNYLISLSANPLEGGVVTGGGSYTEGAVCEVSATPASHYEFVRWTENGQVVSTNPTFSFVVTGNRFLVADFDYIEDVEETQTSFQLYPNPTHQYVWIQVPENTSLKSMMPFKVYDLQGHLVLVTHENPIDLSTLPTGTYLLLGKTILKR